MVQVKRMLYEIAFIWYMYIGNKAESIPIVY